MHADRKIRISDKPMEKPTASLTLSSGFTAGALKVLGVSVVAAGGEGVVERVFGKREFR